MRPIDADAIYTELTNLYKNATREARRAYSNAIDVICDADTIEGELTQWISIDEKLPEIGQDVLIHYVRKSDLSDGGITITKRVDYIWFGHAVPTEPYWKDPWQYFHSDYDITHWMLLPKAPEVKAE